LIPCPACPHMTIDSSFAISYPLINYLWF